MSAHEQRLDVLDGHAQLHRDEGAVTGRIKHPGHAHHALARKTARHVRDVCHNVERIRHDDDDRIGAVFDELLRDRFDDRGVLGEQVVAAHARLARQAGRDYADIRPGGVGVIIRPAHAGIEEVDGRRLLHIERFALGQALDDIDQDDFPDHVFSCDAVGDCRADVSGSNDGDLHDSAACS